MKTTMPEQLKKTLDHNESYRAEETVVTGKFKLHWHEFYEIEYVVSGEGVNIINGKEYEMSAGTAYILRPTDMHEVRADTPFRLYHVSFMPDNGENSVFSSYLNGGGLVYGKLPPTERNLVIAAMDALIRETERPRAFSKEYSDHLMGALLACLMRLKTVSDSGTDASPILRAVRYVHDNFAHNPTLREAADEAGFQINYFCKKFKAATGKVYKEYLNDLKSECAMRLLASTDAPVTELCLTCGFTSLSQFHREFRKRAGMSPLEYRSKRSKKWS